MKIALLTSGGDAPGMNACIRAVVRTGLYYGYEVYGIREGYKGLVEDEFVEMGRHDVSQILDRGGTILGSARLDEFKEKATRKIAIDNLKRRGIDYLVVIGGDGTFRGAIDLEKEGVKIIAIPATIDNDVSGTEYTVGFFSALDTSMEAIDKLRDTSFSHQRCTVVEVMGRDCGDLSIYSGIACGAEMVITSETGFSETDVMKKVQKGKDDGKRHLIIVVAENITNVGQLAKKIQKNTGYDSRASVLGYIQRGGSPSAFDRVLASKMGILAIDLIKEDVHNQAIVSKGLHIDHMLIEKALSTKVDRPDLYQYLDKIR
ncbi:MAG: 6-phosphofructokinase [Candidatus Izimaplasma sp.]|nr:6-phosphofructokinase [Candidatus Izimaplasma bacterium]